MKKIIGPAIFAIIGVSCFPFTSESATTAKTEPTVIDHGQYVSTGNQIQQYSANITLTEKDQGKPLTFSFYNGPNNLPKFAWVRVFVSDESNRSAGRTGSPGQPTGRMIVSEASFRGGLNRVDLNLTGIVKAGSTSTLIINGAGLKGSAVGWTITVPAPAAAGALQLTSISPTVPRGGGNLTISGNGFSNNASDNVVYFNQTKATVSQASPTTLQVSVPPNVTPGKYTLQVTVNGAKSNAFAVKVQGTPELTRSDWQAGPSGSTVIIYGKNFSEDASENNVYFNKEKATVVSATPEALTVTVPYFPELAGSPFYLTPTPLDVTVMVGTTPAKGHLTFYSAKAGWQ